MFHLFNEHYEALMGSNKLSSNPHPRPTTRLTWEVRNVLVHTIEEETHSILTYPLKCQNPCPIY